MNLRINKSSLVNSIFIAIVIHIFILIALSQVYICPKIISNIGEVNIEFTEYDKIYEQKETPPEIIREEKHKTADIQVKEIIIENLLNKNNMVNIKIVANSNSISQNDSVEKKNNWLDSIVVAEPNLQLLNYAASKYLKSNPVQKSDSVKLVERIRKMMQNYYSHKYPTPVHKFGDRSPGIAIGDIINIFSSDTLNEERIKKYLKIGKYDLE